MSIRPLSRPWHRHVCREEGWTRSVCDWLAVIDHTVFVVWPQPIWQLWRRWRNAR